MNLFGTVKNEISARQAADLYGIEIDRTGKALCIFHSENRPSMKIYDEPNRGFYCFSCGHGGTVIDLVAQLFEISPREAALKLANDFNIQQSDVRTDLKPRRNPATEYKRELLHYTRAATDYLLKLEKWLQYAPREPGEEPNILFLEAIRNHDQVEYIVNTLLFGTAEERAEILIYHRGLLIFYEQRISEFTGRI